MENKSTTKASSGKVKIKLPRALSGAENFITVSVNGEVFKIQKGVEVEVPGYIAQVIENSYEEQDKAEDYLQSIVH